MVVRRMTSLASDAASSTAGIASGVWATLNVVHRMGLTTPVRPDRLVDMVKGVRHWGRGSAAAYAMGAARDPDRVAVIDERDSFTFSDIDRQSSIVAAALAEQGVASGDS